MSNSYNPDPVATMLADLENRERHGIDCGRGNFSANQNLHDRNQVVYSSGGISTTVNTPREPIDGDKIGMWFCASWIGIAAKSWWAFGGVFAVVAVISIFAHSFLKGARQEKLNKIMSHSLFGLSLVGVTFLCYFPWGWEGVIGSVLVMAALAAIYFLCRTRLAKNVGTWLIKFCKLIFYIVFIGMALYGGYLLLTE